MLAAALLTGCAAAPPWPTTATPDARPTKVILNEVPFFPQEKYQCGPAALATTLNAQGLSTTPGELKDQVYIPGRQGLLQVEMVATARSYGMVVYPLAPELTAILDELAAGHPVLVLQNLRLDWWPQWHFAVVTGYDQSRQVLFLNTGIREQYTMPYTAFFTTWHRAERWAVTVLPPEQLPATADRLAFLRAAHDLESTNQHQAALTAYRTAEQRWRTDPAPVMAQGNLAFELGKTNNALKHFRRVVARFPDYAHGWNNLAYTLAEAGCPETSKQAMACARQLDAEQTASSERSHRTTVDTSATEHCIELPECPAPTAR